VVEVDAGDSSSEVGSSLGFLELLWEVPIDTIETNKTYYTPYTLYMYNQGCYIFVLDIRIVDFD
jgi:hypothetical protein